MLQTRKLRPKKLWVHGYSTGRGRHWRGRLLTEGREE